MATVLLLGAVMALSRLAFLARRHATNAEDQTQSQLLCHNLMQEIVLGVRPAEDVSPTSFAGEEWVYSIDVEPVEGASLSCVTVRVARLDDESTSLPTADEMGGFQLVRWLRTGQSQSSSPADLRHLRGEANP
jgi:Tfp pilus assembly protein PilV